MVYSRFNTSRVKHLYERCLRLIYSDKITLNEEVLEKDE